jgi:hypothetical protein
VKYADQLKRPDHLSRVPVVPLSFDSTGFHRQDQRSWQHPVTGDHVVLDYFDLVPDLPAPLTDLPKLQHEMTLMAGVDGCLIEAHIVDFAGIPALLRIVKLPLPNRPAGQAFTAVITVPKATCSANLQIICPEGEMTGFREAALAAEIGVDNWFMPHPYAPGFTGKLPYHAGDDARWDPQFPNHPLTRARGWIHHALRTAQIDPRFAALPPFQPMPPTAPGSRLHTVVAGVPIGGYLPLWFDNESAMFWRMDEPDKVLARIGSGTTGRSPLDDDWRRDCLLFDLDAKTLFMTDRYQNENGGTAVEYVPGRLTQFGEAQHAVTPESRKAAYQWIGRAFEQAERRNEFVVLGPGGTQMYGKPRVLMVVLTHDQKPVSYIEARPVPVDAEMWRDHRHPNLEITPDAAQSFTSPVDGPDDIIAGGVLAGYAAASWEDVHPLHLAVSFKQKKTG